MNFALNCLLGIYFILNIDCRRIDIHVQLFTSMKPMYGEYWRFIQTNGNRGSLHRLENVFIVFIVSRARQELSQLSTVRCCRIHYTWMQYVHNTYTYIHFAICTSYEYNRNNFNDMCRARLCRFITQQIAKYNSK